MALFYGDTCFCLAGALFYIPLLLVIAASVMTFYDQSSTPHLTLQYYATFFDWRSFFVLLRSLLLSVVNAIICTCIAYPVAYYLAFYVQRFKTLLLFFLMLPFWISFMVQVYAWFFVLEKHGLLNSLLIHLHIIETPLHLLNTPFAIYVVMLYCYVPFAVMPIYSTLEKFDKRLLEASSDLGATPWQTFMQVTLPLSTLGIRTGFFLALVPSFGEFIIPTLLGGGKQLYVGSLISHYFLLARNFSLGSAFTCLSGLVLIMSSCVWYALFKRFSKFKGAV